MMLMHSPALAQGLQRGSLQCAAAAVMLDSSAVLSACSAPTVECACKPPATRRHTDAAVKLPPGGSVIISGKPHAKHRAKHRTKRHVRVKRLTLQRLLLGGGDEENFGGPPDDGSGGWSGGGDDGDAGSGGSSGNDDGDWLDGGGGARDDGPLAYCFLWGRYYETAWLWYICCLLCLTNTWWHLQGQQPAHVCAA